MTKMKLSDIFEIKSTGLDKIISQNETKIKLINYMDVYKNSINYESLSFTSGTLDKIEKEKVKKNDLLVTPTSETREDIFHSAVIKEDIPAVYSYHTMCLRPKISISSLYFKYYFDSRKIKMSVGRLTTGTTRMTLSKSDLSRLELSFPSLDQQTKIGSLLSTMDKLIEDKEELISEYEIELQKVSNDIFKNRKYKYEYLSLEDISLMRTGFTPPTKDESNFADDYTWFGVVDMDEKYISKSKRMLASKTYKENKFVKAGTLLMSFKLTVGKLSFTEVDCFTNEAIVNFNFNDEISPEYMYYALKNIDISSYGSQATQGITLNNESLKSIIVPITTHKNQLKIANLLSSMDKLIDLHKQELEELKNRKKYYLNKIFN